MSEPEEAAKRPGSGLLLLVEDSEADILFFKRALAKAKGKPDVPLEVALNGVQAVEYLSGAGPYADRALHPLPSLLLLDLKLPRMSGLEVLEWMRSQPSLSSIRTVVLMSSSEEKDIRGAYALGAAAYVVKPVDVAGLQGVVEALLACRADPDGSPQAHLGRHAAPVPTHP